MNAIMTLVVYRHGQMWVFDDIGRGLIREPFVAGIPAIFDRLVKPGTKVFQLTFSASPIPENVTMARQVRQENGGNWYRVEGGAADGMEGWLCPALFKFFTTAPRKLWFTTKEA